MTGSSGAEIGAGIGAAEPGWGMGVGVGGPRGPWHGSTLQQHKPGVETAAPRQRPARLRLPLEAGGLVALPPYLQGFIKRRLQNKV